MQNKPGQALSLTNKISKLYQGAPWCALFVCVGYRRLSNWQS